MWRDEKNGKYSVKSGYKLIRNIGIMSSTATPINWKLLWKLKVQAKIRNFLWRAFSSCLPTLTALQGRRVEVVEWCPLCHHGAKDDFHALVSCSYARNVWSLSPIGSNVSSFNSLPQW